MSSQNLETQIKLSLPFVNEYYKGVVGVIVLESIFSQHLDQYLSQFRLTYQQFNILRILKGQYPNDTQLNLLKDRMLHKQSDVSRLVDRLVGMELVDKKINELNKRKLSIKLSAKGLELINRIDVNDPAFQSLTSALNRSEIEQFNDLVGKMLGVNQS
ncbi:MAG: winged helix-turn-helix transcriptional regulator [Bacteroidetes bacterium]|jgi:MarR family multiple gene transcriptional regulator MgrA|nr:winged helix-turn-helix transcriptional regulator [Bacteroidota bacterium]